MGKEKMKFWTGGGRHQWKPWGIFYLITFKVTGGIRLACNVFKNMILI